jgi:tetratricopeptide (TPR) repeat protein
VTANLQAIEADRAYRGLSPSQDFYRLYMAHNHHMLAFAATMRGQSELALTAIREMAEGIPSEWVEANPGIADGFLAMPLELLVRFGRWDEVLAAPRPAENLPLSRVLYHCSRGVALAAQGDVAGANREREALTRAKEQVPEDAAFGNNLSRDIAAVAEHLLAGETLYREGQTEKALQELQRAAELEDALRYDEPPGWIHPVRHALGATLLKEQRAEEAEAVYREDLKRFPNNGWALYGLAESLRLQGKDAAADEARLLFRAAWIEADVEITSSCFCQPGIATAREKRGG